jgi:hypothetical protein
VPGPRNRVRRTELVPSPAKFRGLLSSEPDAPGIGEGLSGSSPRPNGGHGANCCDARSRRTPSSVRAPRRIKASSAGFHPHWPVPLRRPNDRHRGHARAPIGIAERALSADDAARVKSKGFPSRIPKGRGSRTIRPQDEVSENDSYSSHPKRERLMTSRTRAGGSISSARQTPMREATAKYQPPKPSEFKERSNVTWKGCGHHDPKPHQAAWPRKPIPALH